MKTIKKNLNLLLGLSLFVIGLFNFSYSPLGTYYYSREYVFLLTVGTFLIALWYLQNNIREKCNYQNNSSYLNTNENKDLQTLYDEALDIISKAGKASTSLLQRRMQIGYSKAAQLLDMLEENNIVEEANGSNTRKVLINKK